jgi:carboxyl-terminal processing protease
MQFGGDMRSQTWKLRLVILVTGMTALLGTSRADMAVEGEPEDQSPTNDVMQNVRAILGGGEDPAAAYQKMELLTEILLQIKRNYVEEKNYGEIMDGAIHGMLQSLDPYSDYMPGKTYGQLQDDTRGNYGGVGLHIGTKSGILTVLAPIEDTPAFNAGILAGDRIVEIDGEKTMGLKQGEAVDRLRGREGTEVRLTISREGEEDYKEFTLIRANIDLPTVKGAKVLRGSIGYVRLTQFAEPTARDMEDALTNLATQNIKGLVLDLRNNPGGLVVSAIGVASRFLKEGQLIVSTRGRSGRNVEKPSHSIGKVRFMDYPLVVLVNGFTASAGEIVAGALQDNKRAILIGETTYGKASVQSVIGVKAEEGAGLRLTTAHYFTPSGRQIHGNGVEPDITIYVKPEELAKVMVKRGQLENPNLFTEEEKKKFEDVSDRQLERALDLLEAWGTVGRRLYVSP